MLYTLGHSTTPIADFLQILPAGSALVDVRSHPTSRRNPQYDRSALEAALGDRYEWWPELGGWDVRHAGYLGKFPGVNLTAYLGGHFPKQRIAAKRAEDGPSWTSQGLYDYAYFMTTPEFIGGAARLLRAAAERDVTIVCCEAVCWRCHRSMISDYALRRGVDSVHLTGRMTKTLGVRTGRKSHSAMIGNRLERYPAEVVASWPVAVGVRDV